MGLTFRAVLVGFVAWSAISHSSVAGTKIGSVSNPMNRTIVVCATPDAGFTFLEEDGKKAVLKGWKTPTGAPYTLTSPAIFRGADRKKVVGYNQDVIEFLFKTLGNAWDYELHVYPTYSAAFYHTRMGKCDMAVAPFVPNQQRASCPAVDTAEKCPLYPGTEKIPGKTMWDCNCCGHFLPSYINAGLAIITRVNVQTSWTVLQNTLQGGFVVNWFCFLVVGTVVAGHFCWILERKAPDSDFPMDYYSGVQDGLWWALVTVATVGYGDKSPKTGPGRALALAWMLSGFIGMAAVIGSIAGAMSLKGIDMATTPNSLAGKKLCTYTGYLPYHTSYPVKLSSYWSMDSCIADLKAGKVDAVSYDLQVLQSSKLSDPTFVDYIVTAPFLHWGAVPVITPGSPMRDKMQWAIAVLLELGQYENLAAMRRRWFGTDSLTGSAPANALSEGINTSMLASAILLSSIFVIMQFLPLALEKAGIEDHIHKYTAGESLDGDTRTDKTTSDSDGAPHAKREGRTAPGHMPLEQLQDEWAKRQNTNKDSEKDAMELEEVVRKYFNRFDYDNSGLIDTPEELQQLCLAVAFKTQEHQRLTPDAINEVIVRACEGSADGALHMPFDADAFLEWWRVQVRGGIA